MSEVPPTESPASTPASTPTKTPARSPALTLKRIVRRVPGTVVLAALLIVAAVLSGGLVTPSAQQSWFGDIGYGIPAIQNGVWWTPITGTFLVTDPPAYLYPLVFVPLGMGWLEWRRGTRVAVFWFVVGQLFAIVATLVLLAIAAPAGSAWAAGLAALYDAGASGGLFACFAAAVCTLPLPWRPRAQLALASFSIISVLFLGTLGDVQRAAAVALVLAVHLREFGRPTIRERRFTAWVLVVAVGAAQFIISFIPTDGPFGVTVPGGGSVADVVIDAVVVLLIANGLRLGYRVAWIVAIVLAVLNVLVGIAAVALLTLAPTEVADARDDLSLAAATAFLWLLALLYLLYTRTAFRARLRRRVPDASAQRGGDVRQIVMQTGGGALSWMATWRDNAHFYGSDPDTVVAFQTHSGVAIALSDPIAPWREKRFTLAEWVAATEKAGFIPCVFGASEHAREIRPEGWKALQIAEDTIVDLPGLEFTGKRWNTVRTALNRAGRETMTFRLTALADEPHAVRRQIDAISEQWVGEKDLPEMRFTLGAVDEALDPAVRVALAETADGTVDGFLSWLPIYGPGGVVRGYTLDLMRRRDGGFPPVMEFLIASSAAAFRDEGAEIMSLSGAPLAHSGPAGDGVVEKALERIGAALEPVYGFRSLHKFKQKFNPRAEPIYLLFAEEADLPAIGLGITRAFLPDASLADLVRAGADAVRSAR